MKKRVGLARALLLNPKIILFDEPTTGLDPIIKRAIHQLIKDTHEKFGFTAVIVSHEIPEIFDIAQNVAMLYQGKILQFGTADEIRNSAHPVVKQFISGSLDGPIQTALKQMQGQRDMNMVKLEMIVGIFMLIGMLCLGYISIKLGKMEMHGRELLHRSARFDSVSGLKPGARVEVAGVEVGKVDRIALDPKSGRPGAWSI